jgi:hypothetical protein
MPPNAQDPLALIIGAGGAIISLLLMIVLAALTSRLNRIDRDIKEAIGHLSGSDGVTVKLENLNGRTSTLRAEVDALKLGTLSKEIFDRATAQQNEKLEDLKEQNEKVELKVDRIDRTLMAPPPHRNYTPSPDRK